MSISSSLRNRAALKLLPRTALDARLQGQGHYFTGKPCKRGHVDARSAKTWKCLACDRERHERAYRQQRHADRAMEFGACVEPNATINPMPVLPSAIGNLARAVRGWFQR